MGSRVGVGVLGPQSGKTNGVIDLTGSKFLVFEEGWVDGEAYKGEK